MKKTIFSFTIIISMLVVSFSADAQVRVKTRKERAAKVNVKKNIRNNNRTVVRNNNRTVVKRNRNNIVVRRPVRPKVIVQRPNYVKRGYIWTDGYWKWSVFYGRYIWVDAGWRKIKPGYTWQAGYWEETPSGFFWIEGTWVL